jgi:hypothetical protein
LAWAFIEAATFAARFNPRIQSWYERKKRKSGAVKAKKALACAQPLRVWKPARETMVTESAGGGNKRFSGSAQRNGDAPKRGWLPSPDAS